MISNNLTRFNYLKILDNLDFHLIFNNEKAKGRPSLDIMNPDWKSFISCDYWDFGIVLNDYSINDLIDNYESINYVEYLNKQKEQFKLELDDLISKNLTSTESLKFLYEILEFLELMNSCYFKLHIEDHDPYEVAELARDVDYHKNVKITPSDEKKFEKEDIFIKYVISRFISDHKIAIESSKSFIKNLITIVEKEDRQIVGSKKNFDLEWCKSDTDLLELITALLETRSISNGKGNLSRKDAIDLLSKVFNISIKDPESKLTRATSRKKDVSPYLSSLKEAFDNYSIKKDNKLDEIRG
jgi:hypothetical protein